MSEDTSTQEGTTVDSAAQAQVVEKPAAVPPGVSAEDFAALKKELDTRIGELTAANKRAVAALLGEDVKSNRNSELDKAMRENPGQTLETLIRNLVPQIQEAVTREVETKVQTTQAETNKARVEFEKFGEKYVITPKAEKAILYAAQTYAKSGMSMSEAVKTACEEVADHFELEQRSSKKAPAVPGGAGRGAAAAKPTPQGLSISKSFNDFAKSLRQPVKRKQK